MSRIIKRGTIPEPRVMRHTCAHCRTEFEFKETEVNENGKISCPLCHVSCVIFPYRPRNPYKPPYTPWQDERWTSPVSPPPPPKRYNYEIICLRT